MPAHYNDPTFSYVEYWESRSYEHLSEVEAIRKLLNNSHFPNAVDIGGGYGRLIPVIKEFSKSVILIEPSLKQRKIAEKQLQNLKGVKIFPGSAEKTNIPSKKITLVLMIRVMHHLTDPTPALKEI